MKAESGGSEAKPGKELGSAQREARTCPVCGTKFFATADSTSCPVCILRGATNEESVATGHRVQYLGQQKTVLRRPMVGRRLDGLSTMK